MFFIVYIIVWKKHMKNNALLSLNIAKNISMSVYPQLQKHKSQIFQAFQDFCFTKRENKEIKKYVTAISVSR